MNRILKLLTLIFLVACFAYLINPVNDLTARAESPLSIIIMVSDKTYDGENISYSIKYYSDEEFQNEITDLDLEYVTIEFYKNSVLCPEPKDAGNYEIKVIYDDSEGDNTYGYVEESGQFTIHKRSVWFAMSSTVSYGSTPSWNYELINGSFVLGDSYGDLDIDFTWANSIRNARAQAYTNTTSAIGNANYSATINWSYVINKKNISMTIQSLVKTFGDSYSIVSSLNNGHTLSYGDAIDDLNITYKLSGVDFNSGDLSVHGAGVYTLTATNNNTNYNVTFTSGTLTINKYVATIEVSGSCIYGTDVSRNRVVPENEDIFTYELKNSLPYEDTFEDLGVVFFIDFNKPVVGSSHPIRSANSNANYVISLNSATLIVTPRAMTAEINNLSVTYGISPQFTLNIIEGSYASGDNINSLQANFFGYQTAARQDPYEVMGQAMSGNYSVTFIEGYLTVNPRSLTVIVGDSIITYGDSKVFTYSLPQGISMPYADSINSLNIVPSAPEKNVGSYQASFNYSNTNYEVTFQGGSYTINKKSIEIKIGDSSIIYGQTPIYSAVLWNSTLVSPDTIADLNITYIPESLNFGERYSISGAYNNPNYNVIFRDGRLDVARKAITVIIDNIDVTYGDTPQYTYRLQSGSTLAAWDTLQSLNIVCSTSGVNVNEAPTQILTTYNNNNYLITFVPGTLIINPRELTIRVKNVTKQFGVSREFTTNDLEILSGTMALGDTLSSLNPIFNYDGTVVGQYIVNLSVNNSNYDVTIESGTLTITKRKVLIEVENIIKPYGDKDREIAFSSSVEGVPFSGKLAREKGEKPGSYQILIGTLTAGDNYELILNDAYMTIDETKPPIAYVGLGILALSFIGIILLVIRKLVFKSVIF